MSKGKHFVVQKGKAMCNKGAKFPSFKVTSHNKHFWNNSGNSSYLAVTEVDTQFNPPSAPFGPCSLDRGNPCKYAPAGQWTKTYDKVNVLGKKCVIESSELMCSVGGKIKVFQHGQSAAVNSQEAQQTEPEVQEELDPLTTIEEVVEDNSPYAT